MELENTFLIIFFGYTILLFFEQPKTNTGWIGLTLIGAGLVISLLTNK